MTLEICVKVDVGSFEYRLKQMSTISDGKVGDVDE